MEGNNIIRTKKEIISTEGIGEMSMTFVFESIDHNGKRTTKEVTINNENFEEDDFIEDI